MSQVKITWKAFGEKPEQYRFITSVEFELDNLASVYHTDTQICEHIYKQTNYYNGPIWDIIQPKLSENRTHTALCIGDEIEINGQGYVCADLGWIKVEDAVIEYLPPDFGFNKVFSVTKKVA